MMSETLIHVDETLNDEQREALLNELSSRHRMSRSHLRSSKPHLLFLAYERNETTPHDLVHAVRETGLHAQLVEL